MDRLYLDADKMYEANKANMLDPLKHAYDPTIGRPAIRTYRAFLYNNNLAVVEDQEDRLVAAADRCARQIDFLQKRHRAQQADWVRNHHDSNQQDDSSGNSKRTTFPIMLVLDNLRSAFNVGSIFRSADACGCFKVITVRHI